MPGLDGEQGGVSALLRLYVRWGQSEQPWVLPVHGRHALVMSTEYGSPEEMGWGGSKA